MGNEIKDYINNIDDNKENNNSTIDNQELLLLKNDFVDPEKLEGLSALLSEKKHCKQLGNMLEESIKSQDTEEQLQQYENFLAIFTGYINNLPHDQQDMTIIDELHQAIAKQREKVQKNVATQQTGLNEKNPNTTNKTETNQTPESGDVTKLTNVLNSFESTEIIQFKGVIDELKNGKLTLEKIQPFGSMMQALRQMNGLSSEQIMQVVDQIIVTKFSDKKTEADEIKQTLSTVLKNGLVKKFIESIDNDLNNIKGLGYDELLITQDLTTEHARVGINQVFHRDENLFNKLLSDFADPNKSLQVQKIVQAYVKSEYPDIALDGVNLQVGKVQIMKDGKQLEKNCFEFKNPDGSIVQIPTGKKDINGQDVLQGLTPFFGDQQGNAIPMEQCLNMKLMADIVPKEGLQMSNVSQLLNQKNTVGNMTLFDAFNKFFDSPFFLQLKQVFYSLLAMMGDDVDKQAQHVLDANYVGAEMAMKNAGSFLKEGTEITYYDALKKLNISHNKSIKERFCNATFDQQKAYIEAATKDPNNKDQENILSILGKPLQNTQSTEKVKSQPESGTTPSVELQSGKADVDGLQLEKKDGYILLNGQPSDGSVYIKDGDTLVKKTITISTDDTSKKETASITAGNPIDAKPDTITKIFDGTKIIYPQTGPLAQGTEDLFRYYALESSSDVQNINPIDALLKLDPRNDNIEKAIFEMKKEFTTNTSNTKVSLQKIFNKGKIAIENVIKSLPQDKQPSYTQALNNWSIAVGIDSVASGPVKKD